MNSKDCNEYNEISWIACIISKKKTISNSLFFIGKEFVIVGCIISFDLGTSCF